ncbi:hypothetical protein JL09_g2014 [Pichia kudriavzevii]|uniref:Uncharacterized protein n=1 Tax=Pichia kudriavzevii TaxID=4909 RepID=A0A099P429_PICKU|nr:hypothetical protein JL09_g2014 [Pichia kudriavzevii]
MSQGQVQFQQRLPQGTSSEMQNFTLDQIFSELKSNDEICRIKSSESLKSHFILISRDVASSEQLAVYTSYINKKIHDLISSNKVNEQLGGISAIDALVDILYSSMDDSPLQQFSSSSSPSATSSPVEEAWI